MMIAVIAYFALGESLNFIDWLAIFVSFFGILVIENPWGREYSNGQRGFEDAIGSIAAVVGAAFIAIA